MKNRSFKTKKKVFMEARPPAKSRITIVYFICGSLFVMLGTFIVWASFGEVINRIHPMDPTSNGVNVTAIVIGAVIALAITIISYFTFKNFYSPTNKANWFWICLLFGLIPGLIFSLGWDAFQSGLEAKKGMQISKFRVRLRTVCIITLIVFGLILIDVFYAFNAQPSQKEQSSQVIKPTSAAPSKSEFVPAPDLKLTIITNDGVTHEIQNAKLTSETDLDLSSWGFSREEINSFVVLTNAERPREEQLFIRREILETMKETYHAVILPMNSIETIAATGRTIRSQEREDVNESYSLRYYSAVLVKMKNGEVLKAITSQNQKHNINSASHEMLVKGFEDLHDFGKADFINSLGDGDIKEIKFPALAPIAIASKSPFSAVITEVGGGVTKLSDLRLGEGDTLTFIRTGSTVKLNASSIRRIELHSGLYDGNTNAIAPDRIGATVHLNSGSQQEFDWKTTAVIGKTAGGWYMWIPGAAIRTIDFVVTQ
jgi:hypothetical protein